MENREDKRDPYDCKEKWQNWIKDKPTILGTIDKNSKLIILFLKDFDLGKNISKSSPKGERSPIRLLALKSRLTFFARYWNKKDFTKLTKDDVHKLFKDMREGKIKKENGKPYTSTGSYVKDWKTFWNWLIKTGKVKEDINEDLDRTDNKPKWVYLTEEQFKTLANHCIPDYKALLFLMLDSGARVTEAYNLRVCDFEQDFSKVTIRGETSKNNYERTINLKLCSTLIKDFVKAHKLKDTDYIFLKKPPAFNKYLKENAKKIFGDDISHLKAKGKFSELTLYDIRHIASCYWLKRYQTHRALMYRMGWTSERFIKYYSEFLGQEDKISDEDMISQEDRTKMQKEIELLKESNKNLLNFMLSGGDLYPMPVPTKKNINKKQIEENRKKFEQEAEEMVKMLEKG